MKKDKKRLESSEQAELDSPGFLRTSRKNAALAASLTEERQNKTFWNARHPNSSPKKVLEEIINEDENVQRVLDIEKNIDFFYIDGEHTKQNTVIYDVIEDQFLSGNPSKIFSAMAEKRLCETARLSLMASRFNKKLAGYRGDKLDLGYSDFARLTHMMLTQASEELESKGINGGISGCNDQNAGIDLTYLNLGTRRKMTLMFDNEIGEFRVGEPSKTIREQYEKYYFPMDEEIGTVKPEMWQFREDKGHPEKAILGIVLEEMKIPSVYIGYESYYVKNFNKNYVELYNMNALDSLGKEENRNQINWGHLMENSYLLTKEIEENALPVTNYHLKTDDFTAAVIGNPSNEVIIKKMGIKLPEKHDVLAPVLRTTGDPYYAVGDTVTLNDIGQAEIIAIGKKHVWFKDNQDSKKIMPLAAFETLFFDRGNIEKIQRGMDIEKSGEKQMRCIADLPALVKNLNNELKGDPDSWEKANGGETLNDLIKKISHDLKFEKFGYIRDDSRNLNLRQIVLKGRNDSLFYDYYDRKFMSGKPSDVLLQKEKEFDQYVVQTESYVEYLNDKLPDFKNSQTSNMRPYVTELLAEAQKEVIHGDGIFSHFDPDRGVAINYIAKGNTPFSQTILYDKNENKFLFGSLDTLTKAQEEEYKREQRINNLESGQRLIYHPNDRASEVSGEFVCADKDSITIQVDGQKLSFARDKGSVEILSVDLPDQKNETAERPVHISERSKRGMDLGR
jgi:hypothetical protein